MRTGSATMDVQTLSLQVSELRIELGLAYVPLLHPFRHPLFSRELLPVVSIILTLLFVIPQAALAARLLHSCSRLGLQPFLLSVLLLLPLLPLLLLPRLITPRSMGLLFLGALCFTLLDLLCADSGLGRLSEPLGFLRFVGVRIRVPLRKKTPSRTLKLYAVATGPLTSTSASSQPSRGLSLSSGIRGNRSSPKLFARPTRSRSFKRKMYEASCFEYARTKDTKAFAAYRTRVSGDHSGAMNEAHLVMQGTVSQDLLPDLLHRCLHFWILGIHIVVRFGGAIPHKPWPFLQGNLAQGHELDVVDFASDE